MDSVERLIEKYGVRRVTEAILKLLDEHNQRWQKLEDRRLRRENRYKWQREDD